MGSIRRRPDNGMLFLDFYWQGLRCREQTALTDTVSNRKRLEKVLVRIEDSISLGTFVYRDFFPGSKNANKFEDMPNAQIGRVAIGAKGVAATVTKATTPLFKDFVETWFSEKSVEWRSSHKKNVRAVIDQHLCHGLESRRSAASPRQTFFRSAQISPKLRRGITANRCLTHGSTKS